MEVEVTDPETQSIKTINRPIRLIPIFILNFRIENEVNDLLIKTNRVKTAVFKNETLKQQNDFIDNLSYDMLVIQLPNLNNINEEDYKGDEYKRKLYALLKLFDQKRSVKGNEHRLRLIRKFFPGFLDRVILRLQSADISNPDLEEQMFIEDEYLKALIERDNKISFFMEKLDSTKEQLDSTKEHLDNAKEQLDNTKEQLDNTKEQLDNAKEQLDNELSVKKEKDQLIYSLAKMLKESGISAEEIHLKTGLPREEIDKL